MNTQPIAINLAATKALISSEEQAKELGRWDAEHGNKCDPDAYAYSNEWDAPYWRGDYVYAYIVTKGL